jgi:hypothetical protein
MAEAVDPWLQTSESQSVVVLGATDASFTVLMLSWKCSGSAKFSEMAFRQLRIVK